MDAKAKRELATMLNRAVEIHEAGWDGYEVYYRKSWNDAATEACVNDPDMVPIVVCLCRHNPALDTSTGVSKWKEAHK